MPANSSGFLRVALCVALTAVLSPPAPALAQRGSADSTAAGPLAPGQERRDSLEHGIRLSQEALSRLSRPQDLGRAASVLNGIGATYLEMWSHDSALVYLRRARQIRHELNDSSGLGNTLLNLGVVLHRLGQADSALVVLHEALAIKQALGDRPGQPAVLTAIGLVHQTRTRADTAVAYLTRARDLARQVGDRGAEAKALEVLGSVYQALGREDLATDQYAEAIAGYREARDRDGEASTETMQASLSRPANPDSALARLDRTLQRALEAGNVRGAGLVLIEIGSAHHAAGRPDSALAYYARARTMLREVDDARSEGATLTRMARVHGDQGRADSALAYYRWALPILRNAQERREEGAALVNMGVLHHITRTPAGLAHAVAYYDSADAVLAQVARFAGSDEGRLSFAEIHASLFESWTLAWLEREPQVGRRRAAEAALAASERGRAQALRDLMRRRESAQPDAQAGPAHPGPGENLPNEGRALVSALRGLRVPAVSYMVTPHAVVAFLVRPGGQVEVFKTRVDSAALEGMVEEVRSGMASRDGFLPSTPRGDAGSDPAGAAEPDDAGTWRRPAARLAAILLPAQLRARLPEAGELVIVPSGPLSLLPFALLPLSGGADAESLLGLRYAIRYAPSLRVLASLEAQTGRSDPAAQPLVVGNPAMPPIRTSDGSTFRLSALPHAKDEANSVARRVSASMLTDSAATEAVVRERLGTATLVHLATHGMAYSAADSARDSYIVLAGGQGHDGRLTVGEVLDAVPAMRAELVVLSACQTGMGNLARAEGTVGLQRAFLARGARGVLVSLWSVGDSSTSVLMQSFYKHWLDGAGMSRAEALRQAQLELARSRDFAHPRSWAAFQLVGAR